MLLRLLIGLGLFSLAACGGGQAKQEVLVHDVYFECDEINTQCNSGTAGKTVYVGLTTDLNFDCASELLNLSPLLFQAQFDYSGQGTLQYDGSYVYGTVSQWANSSGAKALTFLDVDYKLCAFLDDDESGSLGINELMAEQTFHPYSDIYPITGWSLP